MARLARSLNRRGLSVWAPDLPGFGVSQRRRRALSVDELADDLADWALNAGLRGAAFVGNSFGTQVVAAMAARHPGVASRVALVAPTIDARWRGRGFRLISRLPRGTKPNPPAPAGPVARSLHRLLLVATPLDPPSGPSLRWLIAVEYSLAGTRRVIGTYREAMADRIEDRIGCLGVPLLVVRGGDDGATSREWSRWLAALAADGSFAEIAGVDHDAIYKRPEEVAVALAPFLGAPA